MGSIDVPKVIQAAATSNLGVVSLLALVLAALAWRFFQKSGDKVKLIAFGMMFLGAIGFGAAVLTESGNPEVTKAEPTPSPSATSTPAEAAAAEQPAEPEPTPAAAPDVEPVAALPNAISIAGAWHDTDGYQFSFSQTGSKFDYEVRKDGKRTGTGKGSLQGDRLSYRYKDDATVDTGTCDGRLAADRQSVEGRCGSSGGGTPWDFRIER